MNREDSRLAVVDGVTFRSTLEARWAMFFNQIGRKWDYEPTIFNLQNRRHYTPDFRVKDLGWIEIKPTLEHFKECDDKVLELSAIQDHPIFLIAGNVPLSLDCVVKFEHGKIWEISWLQMAYLLVDSERAEEAVQLALDYASKSKIDHMVNVVNVLKFQMEEILDAAP